MTLLAPLGLLAALLALPVLLLHILTPRREHEEVSSLLHWRELQQPVAATQPWQRLRWSTLLLLQLLIVALLALALARPARSEAAPLADHTVFIVDTSASMQATDGSPDRMAEARERLRELRRELPEGGAASLVVAGADSEVVLIESDDVDTFDRVVAGLHAGDGLVDFDTAFTLAEGLASSQRPTGWVLVTDGGVTPDIQRLAPPGIRYEPIGEAGTNRAITSLAIIPTEDSLEAVVTVANTGGPEATQELRVDVDGVTVARQELTLAAGAIAEESFRLPPGARVEAFLEGEDLLMLDNQRAAVAPVGRDVRARVLTPDDEQAFFVEEILAALGVTVVESPSAEVDLVIYDGVDVPAAPTDPFISIAPGTPPAGVEIIGEVERPIPTLLVDDPILAELDISEVAIARAQSVLAGPAEILVAAAEGEPLLLRGRTGDVGWFHLTFDLEASNLPLTVAYPVLISRMIGSLTLSDDVPASLPVGSRLSSLPYSVTVTGPAGATQRVEAGARMPVLDRPGFWTVARPDTDAGTAERTLLAATVPVSETNLSVPGELPRLRPAETTETAEGPAGDRTTSLLPWVVAALLAVLAAELLVSRRRIGVARRQWRVGVALRTVIAIVVVLALIGPQIGRDANDVRVAIVVDVSDSLGETGHAEVATFVSEATEGAEPDEVAVIEVGRTARVAVPFGRTAEDRTGTPPEGDGTDLARAVRLAGSLLDGRQRERVVVVSDGLGTTGTLAEESARLTERGIPVDVHTVAPAAAPDVAVTNVTAPSQVAEDEVFALVARIHADDAAAVTVDVLHDDEVVASRAVELAPGDNEITFELQSGSTGIERYEVRIRDAADPVPQNDRGFAAVGVSGPPRVLVVDGATEAGASIADALTARSVATDRTDLDAFPSPEILSAYTTVVLVDVAARGLTRDQVASLDGFVRDQGKGLVVIGGDRSFALGGYADSALEELLPVRSEVEDPTLEATIAEVLLIDASESMGACHCRPIDDPDITVDPDDPFSATEMVEGGVNKTDISRSAAARAIEALSANDEVGVLAFNGFQEWIIPLQLLPSEEVVTAGLGQLTPVGETHIQPALDAAAEELRQSAKELKHIILFTDGFTPELFGGLSDDPLQATEGGVEELIAQAEQLVADGITVSVVATGEGAAPLLERIAEAGNGRFYPGRDLDEIPEIFVQEARLATRNFVNEGEFVPTVTSTADPVRSLTEAPAVLGYIATTPKPTADVMLQVGDFADPLLASWRIGLGRVTAWTSDGGGRWAAPWAQWDGYADFWSDVVRDTFPLEGASGRQLTATIEGETLVVQLESEDPWPAGAAPVGRVSLPDGSSVELRLERRSDTVFEAAMPAPDAGTYAVGVTVDGAGDDGVVSSALTSRSYPLEYRPTDGGGTLAALSADTGGRGEIEAAAVFDAEGLMSGRRQVALRPWLLLLAALLWPLDVALRRLQIRRGTGLRRRSAPAALRPS